MRDEPGFSTVPTVQRDADPGDGWGELGRRTRFLAQVDLFASSPPTTLTALAAALKPIDVPEGGLVCREGEASDQFFLIESGSLVVTMDTAGQPYELARMGPGQYLGEVALLGEGRRTATVRAESASRMWSLSRSDFDELLEREPGVRTTLQQAAQDRLRASKLSLFEVERRNLAALATDNNRLRIGRGPDNDLVLSSRQISRQHALLECRGDRFRLRDLGSGNGTYVNGTEISSIDLADGDEIWMGDERFIFDRREIQRCVEPRGMRVDVTNLTTTIRAGKKDSRKLLQQISLSILPGEFTAIVGGSGAGKTTLMDAISGVRPATSGRVLYNGRDFYRNMSLYRHVLGYVPQDDIIHTELSVRRTLELAGKLRLPPDTPKADLDVAVNQALESLSLTEQAGLRVGKLSGGQRKRCSIGVELLTRPRIFFLDEPTSGLDPATETHLMRQMRLLSQEGSTLIVTTHATKNLSLCDKIIFLARGGYLAFVGTPQRALRYFQAETFDDIYERLEDDATPLEWAQRFSDSDEYDQVLADQPRAKTDKQAALEQRPQGGKPRSKGLGRQIHQYAVLCRRTFDLYSQNLPRMMPLMMPPITFAILLVVVFHSGSFDLTTDNPSGALQLLFLLTFAGFIFGLLSGTHEIVKEFPIFRRERLVNLGIVPYVLSKVTFFLPLIVILLGLQVVFLRFTDRLPGAGLEVYLRVLITLWLTATAGLAAGLLTSAVAPSTGTATDLISVWIMPQVLFSGALFAVPSMNAIGQFLARLTVARWGFEAQGKATSLNNLFANGDSTIGKALLLQYQQSFARNTVENWAILGLFIIVPLILTCIVLKRRTRT